MDINWQKVDALSGGLTEGELFNEALFALGGRYVYNGLVLPPPTAGSFILLEILKSPYLKGGVINDIDVDNAVFVLSLGKDVVGAVFEDRFFDSPMEDRVKDFVEAIPDYQRDRLKVFLDTYFKYCMHGFEMLPGTESEPKKMSFDTDWLASYVSICNEITGYDMDRITWELPIVMGGFCLARYSRESGVKGVERPQDWKAQLDELRKQVENGK